MDILNVLANLASRYTALINLVLTTFIVMLTGWYAVVTRRMWREMVEARLSGIRPLLNVAIDRPALEEADGERRIKSTLKLCNFGRGPAYAMRGAVSLRYEKPGDTTWIGNDLDLPSSIIHGNDCDCTFSIFGFPTPVNESRKEFLIVLITYQDGEGNSYSLKQVYDLRAIELNKFISRTWQLRLEELRFSNFSRRQRSSGDDSHILHNSMDLILEYRLPRVRDWAK